ADRPDQPIFTRLFKQLGKRHRGTQTSTPVVASRPDQPITPSPVLDTARASTQLAARQSDQPAVPSPAADTTQSSVPVRANRSDQSMATPSPVNTERWHPKI